MLLMLHATHEIFHKWQRTNETCITRLVTNCLTLGVFMIQKSLKVTFEANKWRASHYRVKKDVVDVEYLNFVDLDC